MENSRTLNLEPSKGITFKVSQKAEKNKEQHFSDKLKTILKLK
jgi:hypothetical protein